MQKLTLVLVSLVALFGAGALAATPSLTAAEAAKHIGEHAKVCGDVASNHFAANTRGEPTFINLDKRYPNTIFTIVIWGKYRSLFATPPDRISGRVCVTGRITAFHGKPEIEVTNPAQLGN